VVNTRRRQRISQAPCSAPRRLVWPCKNSQKSALKSFSDASFRSSVFCTDFSECLPGLSRPRQSGRFVALGPYLPTVVVHVRNTFSHTKTQSTHARTHARTHAACARTHLFSPGPFPTSLRQCADGIRPRNTFALD
jgi:hypothetical protein